jgi:hypothetical protein
MDITGCFFGINDFIIITGFICLLQPRIDRYSFYKNSGLPQPEPVQRKITEAELADIQQKQKALLEKHEEMESAQRRLSEARLTRIHNEQRDLIEKKLN